MKRTKNRESLKREDEKMVTVIRVRSAKEKREFACFPLKLYKGCANYMPYVYADERHILNPKKNPMLEECEMACFLAKRGKKTVGRVAAIIQKKYNEIAGKKCVRFSRFDCENDPEAAAALLGAAEAFGKERGMDTIHGPWGFNDQDREGLLTFGFDRRATYATNYNYEYYEKLVTSLGFTDESEWVEYDFSIPETLDKRIAHVAEYIQKKLNLTELAESMPLGKLVKRYGHEALEMTNLAYAALDCYVPVGGKVVDHILKQFATVINRRYFSMLADKDGKVIAMAVVLPSICKPLQKSGGRMTLPTILRLIGAISKPKELEMVLIAVHPDYQKMGVNSVMMARIIKNVIEDKIEHIESNPELVTNNAVQEQWNAMDRQIVKRRKCYQKKIN